MRTDTLAVLDPLRVKRAHLADLVRGAWLAVLPNTTHMSIMAHPALPAMIAHRINTTE